MPEASTPTTTNSSGTDTSSTTGAQKAPEGKRHEHIVLIVVELCRAITKGTNVSVHIDMYHRFAYLVSFSLAAELHVTH